MSREDYDFGYEQGYEDGQAEIEQLCAALIEAEKYNGWHQQSCMELERLRTITPAMIERAARAIYQRLISSEFMDRANYPALAEAALRAALEGEPK